MEAKKRKIIFLLIFLGLLVSGYLSYFKLSTNPFACDFGQCSVVQSSSYSVLFGVPVAIWGGLYYLALGAAFIKMDPKILDYILAWGITFSLYLAYIEIFILKAICGWCMVSLGIILAISFLHFFKPKKRRSLK